jgi:DNA-binding GntR family transcriptional regulator
MLDKNLPLNLAIAKELSNLILTGNFSYKESLPTEVQLMKKYKVSRTTIRLAINHLVNEGMVNKVQGSGTYVAYRKEDDLIKRSTSIFPFSVEMKLKGKSISTKIISFEIISPDKSITNALGIEQGDTVYSFERLRFGDDFPLCLEHSYMPVKPFVDLTQQHLLDSKYYYVEEIKKLKIAYSLQNVTAIISNARLEKLLQLKKYSPLLKIQHTTFLQNGEILDLTTIYFCSDYYDANFIKTRQ